MCTDIKTTRTKLKKIQEVITKTNQLVFGTSEITLLMINFFTNKVKLQWLCKYISKSDEFSNLKYLKK